MPRPEPIAVPLLASLMLGAGTVLLGACTHEGESESSPASDLTVLVESLAAYRENDADAASSPTPDMDAAPASPEPAPTPEPEPGPEPEPEALDAAAIGGLLDDARAELRGLDIKLTPRDTPRGPLPPESGLREAYREHRAIGLAGRTEQVRHWMALAKFGAIEPGPAPAGGPLAPYDLTVTRDGAQCYLHVVVPPTGLAAPDAVGHHQAFIAGERWVNLSDHLAPGRAYLPFKTNGLESVHRQWGKAPVVESLVTIADDYRARTGGLLGIGDVSHVTGGKIEDHWTHKKGVDADLYLLDFEPDPDTDPDTAPPADGPPPRPTIWWHHFKKGESMWSREPKGKGAREPNFDPDDPLSETPSSQRLRILAQIVFLIDAVAYFVHNDPRVLESFDAEVGERRPGRRFLHAENRAYWPAHSDHVHLRWVEGKLPVGVAPRP